MAGPGDEYSWMNSGGYQPQQPKGLLNPMWSQVAGMFPVVGPILGGIVSRIQSQIDIARQNKYNSPAQQIQRLQQAGLPMSALTSGNSGQQSATPLTSGQGIQEGAKNIGLYASTRAQQEQIKLINEQIRNAKSLANIQEGTEGYLLSGKGTDTAGTNLTANLASEQKFKAAQTVAQELTNKITSGEAANQAFRLNAENNKLIAETDKILKDIGFIDEKVESENINQKIQNVLAQYQPQMSQAELTKLWKESGLISEHITGARLENGIRTLNKRILEETAGNLITQSDLDTEMKKIMSAAQWQEFIKTKEYNEMVAKAQSLFDEHAWGTNPKLMLEELSALIYTTISNVTGGAPGSTGLLGLFK